MISCRYYVATFGDKDGDEIDFREVGKEAAEKKYKIFNERVEKETSKQNNFTKKMKEICDIFKDKDFNEGMPENDEPEEEECEGIPEFDKNLIMLALSATHIELCKAKSNIELIASMIEDL